MVGDQLQDTTSFKSSSDSPPSLFIQFPIVFSLVFNTFQLTKFRCLFLNVRLLFIHLFMMKMLTSPVNTEADLSTGNPEANSCQSKLKKMFIF